MRKFHITVNGTSYEVEVEEVESGKESVQTAQAASVQPRPASAPAASAAAAEGTPVKAPMQGNLLRLNVKAGDTVKKGQVLCVLEAMKMENDIPAPVDGVVAAVLAQAGTTVKSDDVILTLK